jgi:3-hydroxyisobutyrate dehydrogenase-like beta-hydroxyacid dehydrogenase
MKIGFAGVGLMGEGMVRHLLAKGHDVRIMAHRNRAPVERLLKDGAKEVASLAELAKDADAIMLCLSTGKVVEETVSALAPHLKPGQIVIDTGTSGPETTRRLAHEMIPRGIRFADAPMTGGPEQIAKAAAGVLCGCDEETLKRIEPILSCYSNRIRRFGPPGAGQAAKVISNAIITGMIALIAEAFGVAHKEGIDWKYLFEVMQSGSGNSGVLTKMLEPALAGDFDGYKFSLANAHKDIGYYCEMVEALGIEESLGRAVRDYFARAVAGGHGGRNVSHLLDPAIDDVT